MNRTTAARGAPSSIREAWLAIAGLSAVFLFEMLDNSILTVALPTIGRDLHASTIDLQWITNSYALVFGGGMLVLGAVADRFGRRRVMLIGLVLLAIASAATVLVTTATELILLRGLMGIAAAMTTPGTIALAFRLFDDAGLRLRSINLISTVGLVGLAIGPTAGGLVLAIAPWQVLLLVNVPVALLAFAGIRAGIAPDVASELHRDPPDVAGGVLGTGTIVLALIAPTSFVERGVGSWMPWALTAGAIVGAVVFVLRERSAPHPLLDLKLVARPLVSSGLAYKAASGLAIAGLGYLVALQLQLDFGWSPALAAIGMLPQVIVLIAAGPFVNRFVERVGIHRAAFLSASAIVAGLAIYGAFGRLGYPPVAIALALVAAGVRVVGVVSGFNVLNGLPKERTSIGAALVDTASQLASAIGIAVAGTLLALLFTGTLASGDFTVRQTAEFAEAVTIGGITLTAIAGLLTGWATLRMRGQRDPNRVGT